MTSEFSQGLPVLNDLTAILDFGSLDLLLQMLAATLAATPTWEALSIHLHNFVLGSESLMHMAWGRISLVCEGWAAQCLHQGDMALL